MYDPKFQYLRIERYLDSLCIPDVRICERSGGTFGVQVDCLPEFDSTWNLTLEQTLISSLIHMSLFLSACVGCPQYPILRNIQDMNLFCKVLDGLGITYVVISR